MNRIITDLSNTLRNVIYGRLSGFSSLLDGKDAENFNQSRVVETAKHQRGENIQVHLWSADDHASTFSMMGRFINNLEQEGTKAVISPTNKEARSMWQVLKRSNKKKELSTEFRFFGSEKNFHALLNIALLIITRLFTEVTRFYSTHTNSSGLSRFGSGDSLSSLNISLNLNLSMTSRGPDSLKNSRRFLQVEAFQNPVGVILVISPRRPIH
jgi:hypothetical protein